MLYFRSALGAIFAVMMSLVGVSPASAVALKTTTNTSLTVGNYLITNTSCAATGTISCSVATWGISPNALGYAALGDIAITIVPNATWVRNTGSDLNVNFTIQTLVSGAPAPTVKGIKGVGTAVTGSGILGDGVLVTDSSANLLGSLSAPFASTDPSAPGNRISFSPQSVVYINIDAQPLFSAANSITSVSFFIAAAPEPASLGLLLVGGLMLAGVRRRLS